MNAQEIYELSGKFFSKILEPALHQAIINSVISGKKQITFSFKNEIANKVSLCNDDEFLSEIISSFSLLLNNKNKRTIFFDELIGLMDNYCYSNNIYYNVNYNDFTFNFWWD